MRKIIERKYISYVVLIALLGSLVLMGEVPADCCGNGYSR